MSFPRGGGNLNQSLKYDLVIATDEEKSVPSERFMAGLSSVEKRITDNNQIVSTAHR